MINRRVFLKHAAVGAAALNFMPLKFALGNTPSTPNVVFVFSDQHRAQSMGYAGCTDLDTPNFDAFAAESINYSNAVSTLPVCTPYRSCLMTGRYPLTTGTFLNDLQLNTEATSIAQSYNSAGYLSGFIGKWHLDGSGRTSYIPPERRQGFQYWKTLECTHNYNNSQYYADDSTTRLTWPDYDVYSQTNDAKLFLNARASDKQPFALFMAWGPPHDPYRTGPTNLLAKYDAMTLTQRDNVPAGTSQSNLAGYYAHIEAMDIAFGQLLDTLAANGLDQNTIVVFTSDHGDMLRSQNQILKQLPWDESARVPFLIRVPGATAKTIDVPLGSPDIMPTLLGLCNIPAPSTCEGEDLSDEILGTVAPPSDRACLLLNPAPFASKVNFKEWRGVRTKRYTFVRRLNPESQPWLLYDNQADPYQLNNLVNNPDYEAIQADLNQKLDQLLCQTGDAFQTRDELLTRTGYIDILRSDGAVDYRNSSYWGTVTVSCKDDIGCDPTAPVVNLGSDMMTWSSEPVSLSAEVENKFGTDLTYNWSSSGVSGITVEFSDPADPSNPSPSQIASPDITITKVSDTGGKTVITVSLAVNNIGRTEPDVITTMQIDVYDNACQMARIGLGKAAQNPTDIAGDDCVTNLEDAAELGKKWLSDTSGLSGPVKKQ